MTLYVWDGSDPRAADRLKFMLNAAICRVKSEIEELTEELRAFEASKAEFHNRPFWKQLWGTPVIDEENRSFRRVALRDLLQDFEVIAAALDAKAEIRLDHRLYALLLDWQPKDSK